MRGRGGDSTVRMRPVTVRDRTRLLGLAAISVGVALLATYAVTATHPLYRLIAGILILALGARNLLLARRAG
ncbi:MAG: hypothetical protein NVSMB29_01390 [Candidatus Dormibacteria bacterium]